MPTELPPTSEVIRNIQEVLAEFCSHCSSWDGEFESLLGELDKIELTPAPAEVGEIAVDGRTLGALERRIANENSQLLEKQDRISTDLADLRKLLIEQTETFTVLLKSDSDA